MSSRPANYSKLSQEQVSVLERFFKEGMKSTTCVRQIEKAAEETALPVAKVKKWIGNKVCSVKKRHMQETVNEEACTPRKVPKPPSGMRGSNGYNLFCSSFFQSDEVKGIANLTEKNKMASAKWGSLAETEKQKWVDKANAIKSSVELDPKTRHKLIEQHIKLVAKELNYLENLGCNSSCMLVNDEKEMFILGSSEGKTLLHSEPAIICKFQRLFDIDDNTYTHEHVRLLFNRKYKNVKLKKPRHYGANEIRKIMAQKDSITFVINPATAQEASVVPNELLVEVFGSRNFLERKISKEDVDTMNINLLSNVTLFEEMLFDCANLFEPDALEEIKLKLNSYISSAEGVVVPIYCQEDVEDVFWLFFYPGSVTDLKAKGAEDKVAGNWLDLESNSRYKVVNKDDIVGKNIIKDDQKLMFSFLQSDNQWFELHPSFKKKIEDVLSKQGFI